MKYQISYLSPTGSCAKLAEAFEDILEDCVVVDLLSDDETSGEIHLVGFEVNENSPKAIPYEIMELLDQLEEKTVLLYATCPFPIDADVRAQLERSVMPFIPDSCDYKGIFLCSGQASDALLANARALAEQRPEDKNSAALLKSCEESIGHPNEDDIMQACLFVTKHIEM